MKEQKSYWLREIVSYLNRTGADNLEIPKEARCSSRLANSVDQYLQDIKQMFIDKCKSDPSCHKEHLEDAWKSMEGIIRKDVERLLEKQASARGLLRNGGHGELEKRVLDK